MPLSRHARLGLSATVAALSLVTVVAPTAADAAPRVDRGVRAAAPAPAVKQPVSLPRGGLFGPTSVWRQDISTAPLNSNSQALVADVSKQVTTLYNGVAAFNVSNYSTNVYTVPANQKRVDVRFDDCQKKGYVPGGLTGPGGQFSQVPVPDTAVPANGSDSQLTVYSRPPTSCGSSGRRRRSTGPGRPAGAVASTRCPRTPGTSPAGSASRRPVSPSPAERSASRTCRQGPSTRPRAAARLAGEVHDVQLAGPTQRRLLDRSERRPRRTAVPPRPVGGRRPV